jgi:transaldolase
MGLRLFLDSADPDQWQRWLPLGLFHGVTTNPTLLRRAGQPCTIAGLALLSERALALGCREVHLQTWGSSAEILQRRGLELAALAPGKVVVKVPISEAGSQAARALIEAGASVTFTACYEVPQVLVAAALHAAYIAPYLGRISDLGRDGEAELIAMQRCLSGLGSSTRLLVASLRDASELGRLAAAGLDTFTISPAIAAGLFASTATAAAAAAFEVDAAAAAAAD